MSELKLVSPLLDGFEMGEPISDHNGVRCCPAMKENSDDKYIVKIISVPASQKQLDALLLTGAYKNADAAAEYFKELAEETVKEARLLQQLAKLEGFLSYEGWQIVPMEGYDTGYDVYLLGSYKRSLEKHLRCNTMTHLGVVNLGIDLCTALSLCRRAGFIYTDLKPGNIYITNRKEYCIGDLGFAKLSAMKYTSLPQRYISRFTPPELHDPIATLNPTVDTYAVGMILYMIYNNGHIPFETKAPMMILPAPLNADYEMAEIILKACDPNPRKRYQTPVEMGKALISYLQRNSVNDVPIVPPGAEVSPSRPVWTQEVATTDEEPVETIAEAEAAPEQPEELQFMETLVSDDTAPGADDADHDADVKMSDEVDQILAQVDELMLSEADTSADEDISEIAQEPETELDEIPGDDEVPDIDEILNIDEILAEAAEETEADAVQSMEESVESVEDEVEQTEIMEESEVFDVPDFSAGDDIIGIDDEEGDLGLDFDLDSIPVDEEGINDADPDSMVFDLPQEDALPEISDDFFTDAAPRRKKRGWIAAVIVLLILALLGAGAFYYYSNFYLMPIDKMEINGFEDSLTVSLSTDADVSLLRITCTDTYGNKQEKGITDGVAVFTDLKPDTMYKIAVTTEGFHKLTGSVSGSYTTAQKTRIVDFTAKSGIEDGSVILNFTVDGPESDSWTIEYSAEGEPAQFISFTGHMVTINDLTVGKLYTFTLSQDTSGELYLDGKTTLEYLASKVVVAENLSIVSCVDGVLTAQWDVADDVTVEGWSVRCYSEGGFDETITVTETSAQFSNISSDTAYTVEVTAAGMSQSVRAFVTANPITVTDAQANYAADTGMVLTWKSSSTPAGGWLVMYSLDGSDTTEMISSSETTATIKNVIPNATYSFHVMAADGSTVFGGNADHPGIEETKFNRYGLSADQIQSSLCRTPEKDGWTYEDVADADYTTTYAPGESASLVLYTSSRFYLEKDETTVMFVIRNADGMVIPTLVRTKVSPWRDLWPNVGKYCYLDVPVMPTEYGDYKLEVYFNGATALTKNFSIISDIG